MSNDLVGAFGGKKQRSPVRTADTLISEDYVEVVLGLFQGPAKGLVPGTKANRPVQNFFIGETPLQNAATGTSNFSDFNADFYYGDDDDGEIKTKLGGTTSNMSIGVRLAEGVDVVRQTPSTMRGSIDQLEFRIMFNQLYLQNDSGIFEMDAKFAIAYKRSDSPTWLYYKGSPVTTIHGKTTNGYPKDFVIEVPRQSVADYDVRVTKLNPDNSTTEFAEFTWESLQMTTKGFRKYNSLAVAHLYGQASNQFNSIPDFSGIYDGLIVRVPTNYNTETRTYDETVPWDGSFKSAYTNNGPWCLYEAITNTEFGLAKYVKTVTANRYEFYAAAKWCDEMVSDGKGGLQPRFTYNDLITDLRPGLEALRYIAGSFNSVIYDDGNGMIRLKTDQYKEPVQLFTPENVSKEGFTYTFTDITTRINDTTVAFINPDLDWEEDRRKATIDTSEYIEANGLIPEEFTAVGCIDVHEAMRRANYRILTANTEICQVAFVTSRYGVITELFDTILIADPDAGWSTGGRIKSIKDGVIYLRDPVFFSSLAQVKIKVQTYEGLVEIEVAPTATGPIYSLTIINGTLPSYLPDRTVFTAENNTVMGIAKPFKVLKIEAAEGSPDQYQILALEINVNKYADGDANTISDLVEYSAKKPGLPGQVYNLVAESGTKQLLRTLDGNLIPRIHVSWIRPLRSLVDHYEIHWQESNSGDWQTAPIYRESCYINGVVTGRAYDIQVISVSTLSRSSQPVTLEGHVVLGKEEPPPMIQGLLISGGSIVWTEISLEDVPDLRGYLLRFHYGQNTDWASASKLHEGFLTENSFRPPFRLTGEITVLAKSVDTSSIESTQPTWVVGDLGPSSAINVVQTVELDPTFPGTYEGCTIVAGELVANASDSFYGPDNESFYGLDAEPFYDQTTGYNQIVYITGEVPITSAVTGSITSVDIIADGTSALIEYREFADSPFYGADTDPFYGPDWEPFYTVIPSAWKPWRGSMALLNGSYQWKVTLNSGTTPAKISSMAVVVDAPSRSEILYGVTIASTGTVVPYTMTGLIGIKSVVVQLHANSVGGRTYTVDHTNPLAPVIFVYNDSGIAVNGVKVNITIGAY